MLFAIYNNTDDEIGKLADRAFKCFFKFFIQILNILIENGIFVTRIFFFLLQASTEITPPDGDTTSEYQIYVIFHHSKT